MDMLEYEERTTIWSDLEIFARIFQPPAFTQVLGSGLLLHGGGEGNSTRTVSLCAAMARQGLRIVSFDFQGQGKSEGSLIGSSLERRRDLAHHIAKEFLDGSVDLTIGFSMGGPTALDIAVDFPELGVSQVFLVCAALYATDAFSVPFGPDFKAILTRENSWQSSDVFEKLAAFRGAIYVITPEDEKVIPHDVTATLFEAARQCRAFGLLKVPGISHQIGKEMTYDGTLAIAVGNLITAMFDLFGRGLKQPAKLQNG